MGRDGLAGAAHLELVSGVVRLRPEDAMFEAMLSGWRAQQAARGLREDSAAARERLMRRFAEFTGEYPWNWQPGHVDEWSLSLTAEHHLAPSTIRAYQGSLRQFSTYLCDSRYGWAAACQREFGPEVYPVAIMHEWNTIPHLNDYEGDPEARPFTREELQRFLDYADEQVDRAVAAKRKGALAAYRDATLFKVLYGWGLFSRVRPVRWKLGSRVRAAQRLLDETLCAATGVAQRPGPACHLGRAAWLSWVMSSRLVVRAAARSSPRSSSCSRRSMTCCSRWLIFWLRASISAGAPSPDSCHACSPRAWDKRFSRCWMRVLSRTARS